MIGLTLIFGLKNSLLSRRLFILLFRFKAQRSVSLTKLLRKERASYIVGEDDEEICSILNCCLGIKREKKMFFHIVLERNMQLHPRHFGRDLREKLVSKLMKDVEGTCRYYLFCTLAYINPNLWNPLRSVRILWFWLPEILWLVRTVLLAGIWWLGFWTECQILEIWDLLDLKILQIWHVSLIVGTLPQPCPLFPVLQSAPMLMLSATMSFRSSFSSFSFAG